MNRALPVCAFLAAGVLFAACTRPAGEPPADRMATMVAATLTAEPTLPPSATPPPSQTPVTSPSATATHTPTEGPSPTAPPPELPPEDPRYGLNLSAPDYRDDFGSQFTWFGPNFEGAVNIWEDGHLRASDLLADFNIWWSTTIREIDAGNVYVEVTARTESCAGKDGFGLALRVSGTARNSGYTLEFSCDGFYRLRTFSSGTVETTLDWSESSAIQPGPGATNRMGFMANGDRLDVFANNTFLASVTISDYFYGTFGLFASAEDTSESTVLFDDFALWYLQQ